METERLVLRKFDSCDAEFLYQLNNDKIVNKYRSSDSMPMEKCVDSINGWKEKYDGKQIFGVYIMTLRSDSTPIGLIAVVGREDSDKAELGYRLMPQYWRMGYCREAAKALIDRVFADTECKMVYAETHPENSSSVNLLFSLGFKELKNVVEGSGRLFCINKGVRTMIEEVRSYYDSAVEREWNRLNNPYSMVEFRSTMYLIEKYFPSAGSILDIGSGPGRYSLNLLKRGYKVSLLDISKNELEFAKRSIEEQGLSAEAYYCKSALELAELKDNKYDSMLIMGPLYHIHDREQRIKVLKDALGMLNKSGTVIISYINTWGVLKSSVSEFPESFEDKIHFDRYIKGDLKFTSEESFTTAFFTTPQLALEEVQEAGFDIISYAGAESFLSGLNIQMYNLKESLPQIYENYLEKAAEFCEQPQYRDTTEHLHIVARKR